MFTLSLTDPLWRKLDDAHRDRDIPDILRSLSMEWNEEKANSLFWDCLCHQDSCYGATYASVPHLLDIAKPPNAPEALAGIAHFCGHVSLVAYQEPGCCGADDRSIPQGLPLNLAAWDRKLDPYRSLAEYARRDLANPDYPENVLNALDNKAEQFSDVLELMRDGLKAIAPHTLDPDALDALPQLSRKRRQAELDHYTELLARPAMTEADLEVIAQIRDAFFQAQDAIAALCAQAYEAEDDSEERRHFLSGMMAAMGDRPLAELLERGDTGGFRCRNCDWQYEYAIYEQRMACYASPVEPGEMDARSLSDDPAFLEHQDGAPHRADFFVQPCERVPPDTPASHAMKLVTASNDPENRHRLHVFKGSYLCGKCDAKTQLA